MLHRHELATSIKHTLFFARTNQPPSPSNTYIRFYKTYKQHIKQTSETGHGGENMVQDNVCQSGVKSIMIRKPPYKSTYN